MRQIKSNARHRRSRVIPNARQRSKPAIIGWKRTRFGNGLRRPLDVPGAPVIAQTSPMRKQILFGGLRQRIDSWKSLQESFVVGNYRRYACLLQHHFRQPNRIRITRPPPRQIALIAIKPLQQISPELLNLILRQHALIIRYFMASPLPQSPNLVFLQPPDVQLAHFCE